MADDQKPIGPCVLDSVDAAAAVRALRRRRPGEELDWQPLDGSRHIAVDVPYQHGWFHLKMRDADGNTETWAFTPRDGILVAELILQATHTVMQDEAQAGLKVGTFMPAQPGDAPLEDNFDQPCRICDRPARHHAPGAVCPIFTP
jgi:hypothetical protein